MSSGGGGRRATGSSTQFSEMAIKVISQTSTSTTLNISGSCESGGYTIKIRRLIVTNLLTSNLVYSEHVSLGGS